VAKPEEIRCAGAPAPVGPYSQGVAVGELVFTSGQIPLDPATGKPVGGGIEAETERVIDNLAAVLEAAGSSLERVVKTTVFLTDLGLFAAMNQVYARRFTGTPRPARSTVEVPALALGVSIEIEAIALRDPR
jgi:2-iminobutanoate/2-iminopropanoate deaminase